MQNLKLWRAKTMNDSKLPADPLRDHLLGLPLAFIRPENNFKQDMLGAILRNKYSTDKMYEYEFDNLSAGQVSAGLEMEYFTGACHPG